MQAFPQMTRLFCTHDDICGVPKEEVVTAVAGFGGEKRVVPGGGKGPFAGVNIGSGGIDSDKQPLLDAEGKAKSE